MSIDFTFAQVGPYQPLYELMSNIEKQLDKIGFKKGGSVYKVDIDDRGVFDENTSYVISGKQFKDSKFELQNWQGLSVEYNCREFSIYLLIGNCKKQYLNAFIEVSDKIMNKLISDDKTGIFMRFVSIIAVNIKSQGGFGTYELPFLPIPPEKIVSYIFNNPEGNPSLLGIIPFNIVTEFEVKKMALNEFNIFKSVAGFYVLEHKDFKT